MEWSQHLCTYEIILIMLKNIGSYIAGLLLVLSLAAHSADSDDEENIFEFQMEYLIFTNAMASAIEKEDLGRIANYLTKDTYCGFDGERCIDTIKRSKYCQAEALMWFRMGCVIDKSRDEPNKLYCSAPQDYLANQLGWDETVLRNNSSFGLVFDTKTKKMQVSVFFCGGE